MSMTFPIAHMSKWKDNLIAALEYIESWRVDAPRSLTSQQLEDIKQKIVIKN
ncbi:MAG: hypothetical protein COB13_004320 [OCS116 cluster bacterium]|nr:hypothetical protein [OCS116 cluster bacterium]